MPGDTEICPESGDISENRNNLRITISLTIIKFFKFFFKFFLFKLIKNIYLFIYFKLIENIITSAK